MENILSKEECKKVVSNALNLTNNQQFEIINYEILPVSSEILGFMGEYYKLIIKIKINYIIEQNLKCFIKIVPIKNAVHRQECIDKGFFVKEVGIYRELLTNIQKFVPRQIYPKCYYNRPDMLVLEDLFEKGYRHMSSDQTYTKKIFETVLKNMAGLHASSIAFEIETNANIGEKYMKILTEKQLSTDNVWSTVGLKSIESIAKIHPKYQTEAAQEFISQKLGKLLRNVCNETNPSTMYRNALCHRDVWDKNIFFKFDANEDPIECLFVDFQLTRYNPPALDVLFFLYIVTNRDQRDQYIDHCLQFYYENLIKNFEELSIPLNTITWEEFKASCNYVKVVVLVLKAICTPLVELPRGLANQMKTENPDRFNEYMNVNRDEMILKVMETSDEYKKIVYETVEELVDQLMNDNQF